MNQKTFKLKYLTLAVVSALALPTEAQSAEQWYRTTDGRLITTEQLQMETILAPGGVLQAWARGYTGLGVKVGVIDQGFDQKHSDLKGQVLAYKNFYIGTADTVMGVHGTAMSSVIAGKRDGGSATVGVAPDAQLILAQVGAGGTSTGINATAATTALGWMQTMGADVVNMSFGSTFDNTFQSQIKQLSDGTWQAPTKYGSLYGTTSMFNGFVGANNTGLTGFLCQVQ